MTAIFVRGNVQHANSTCADTSRKLAWGNVRFALLLICWAYRYGISLRWLASLLVFPMAAKLILLRYRWSTKPKSCCVNWVFGSYVCAITTKLPGLKWNALICHA